MKKLLKKFVNLSFERDWTISPELHYRLGQCEAMVKNLTMTPLPEKIRERMLAVSLIKGAMSSTAIEGNTLSEEQVGSILAGKSIDKPSMAYQEQEVRNVLEALNSIRDKVVLEGWCDYVTPGLIREFNRLVCKELGAHFEADPGVLRSYEVSVGRYVPPNCRYVEPLLDQLCQWLRKEFHFRPDATQNFSESFVEAVVAHLYLVWIHPFGDGNGRTARLLEFYVLLRAGLPDICSHILSNHYNNTREEYYRELEKAQARGGLGDFLAYSILGFQDGLDDLQRQVQDHLFQAAWKAHVHTTLESSKILAKARMRYLAILESLSFGTQYKVAEIPGQSPALAKAYASLSLRTLYNDLGTLTDLGLLRRAESDAYCLNIQVLQMLLPLRRNVSRTPCGSK